MRRMSLRPVPASRVEREDTGSPNCWKSRLKNGGKGEMNSRRMLHHATSLSAENFSLNLSLGVKIVGMRLGGAGRWMLIICSMNRRVVLYKLTETGEFFSQMPSLFWLHERHRLR